MVSGEGCLPCLQLDAFVLCPHVAESESGVSSHKGIHPIRSGPQPMTSFNLYHILVPHCHTGGGGGEGFSI